MKISILKGVRTLDRIFSTKFLKGKKVLVTGHSGFIGSWLTQSLGLEKCEILGYSLKTPSHPNLHDILKTENQITEVKGDIRNKDLLTKVVKDFDPEIVYHLASQPIVLRSYEHPEETYLTNVIGTVNLLNSLRNVGSVKTIVVMTSDKVYKNNEVGTPFIESDALGGNDPYSASKACQDVVVNSFRESYFSSSGVGISSVRAGNVIGGGDWGEMRIVPDIVRRLSKSQPVNLRNPKSTRPWQYVLDLISGLFHLTDRMLSSTSFAGDWNIGPIISEPTTVKELTEKILFIWGQGKYSIGRSNEVREAKHLGLDISKARNMLGWIPIFDLDRTLKETIEWYKSYYIRKEDMQLRTNSAIRRYLTKSNSTKE